jgi:transposase
VYYHHGTLSLYAALNTRTGKVVGKTVSRHTSVEFVAFLTQILAHQPRRREIHVIADNLSAHKTKLVQQFLEEHPRVHLHYTPTYSSWLNQIENWFSQIERNVIARGIFTSKRDLSQNSYGTSASTTKTRYRSSGYRNPRPRIRPGTRSRVTDH